jgi:Flp pilus assembly protein TadD
MMFSRLYKLKNTTALIIGLSVLPACAQGTIKITIPRHTSLSVVQRLNRDGVAAIEKHDYNKAAGFFYKAYLYDPADPFTLNNLGYIAEEQGQMDQAIRFYKLATEQGCDAPIDVSNVKRFEGQPMQAAITGNRATPLLVAEINVEAVQLLSKNEGAEAANLLEQAFALDPHDPFTLNNLGVAYEAVGNDRNAMTDYAGAASAHSDDAVILTPDRKWQGKSVSEIAQANASRLEKRLQGTGGSAQIQALALTLHGVLAENENDWATARRDFMQAYAIDPSNAFSINNRGFVAEKDGDPESAEFFYHKAQQASGAHLRVGLATNRSQQGQALSDVASDSNEKVDGVIAVYSQERHDLKGNVELTPRGVGSQGDSTPASKQPPAQNAAPQLPQNSNPQTR